MRTTRTTVFTDIGELFSLSEVRKNLGRKPTEAQLSRIAKAAMVVGGDGRIQWVGPQRKLKSIKGAREVSLGHATVLPGFVDCHTHLVFAGNRTHEFEMRQGGKTYQQIAESGGGILSTVRATRKASLDELKSIAQKRCDFHLRQGVTTVEIKSGYGLNSPSELKMLEVAAALKKIRTVPTFLGLHALPAEFASADEYVDHVIQKDLPKVARQKRSARVDIFIERGYFSVEHARRYFAAAQKMGFDLVAHAEQLSRSGASELLSQFNIKSFDHLVHADDSDIQRFAKSQTTCVLLPVSDFYLKIAYPRARTMIDSGCRVALATDFNPGSSPSQDLAFTGLLARMEMKMSLPEVVAAMTVGGAHALGLESDIGSLEVGKLADFCVLDADITGLFYEIGKMPVTQTWVNGVQHK